MGRGSGGRNAKPTALKRLTGNPGHRALNENEPVPPAGKLTMPSTLSREGKREWRRLIPVLEQMGVATILDKQALAAYCSCFAQWKQADEIINTHGVIVVEHHGGKPVLKINPAVHVKSDALKLMKSFMIEFGRHGRPAHQADHR